MYNPAVLYGAVWCDGAVVRRVPPHFSMAPDSVEVLPGGSVNLTCVAVGSPMPTIRWRLGAVELTPEAEAPLGRNVLTLSDVRQTATYTCVASSDLGSIEHQAEVQVKGAYEQRCVSAFQVVLSYSTNKSSTFDVFLFHERTIVDVFRRFRSHRMQSI